MTYLGLRRKPLTFYHMWSDHRGHSVTIECREPMPEFPPGFLVSGPEINTRQLADDKVIRVGMRTREAYPDWNSLVDAAELYHAGYQRGAADAAKAAAAKCEGGK